MLIFVLIVFNIIYLFIEFTKYTMIKTKYYDSYKT